jgi:hypothetical protein
MLRRCFFVYSVNVFLVKFKHRHGKLQSYDSLIETFCQ